MLSHTVNKNLTIAGNDALFIILQDPASGQIKWMPFNIYISALKQVTARQTYSQHTLFSSSLMKSQKIGSWKIEDGKTDLFLRNGKLEAEIIFNNTQQKIPCSNIEGLPKGLKPEFLPYYLKDAQARLSQLSDNSYKLYFNPRLLGGFEIPTWAWWVIGGALLGGAGVGLIYCAYGASAAAGTAVVETTVAASTTGIFASIGRLISNIGTTVTNTIVENQGATTVIGNGCLTLGGAATGIGLATKLNTDELERIHHIAQQQAHQDAAENNQLMEELRELKEETDALMQHNEQLIEQIEQIEEVKGNLEEKLTEAKRLKVKFEIEQKEIQHVENNDFSSDDDYENIHSTIYNRPNVSK